MNSCYQLNSIYETGKLHGGCSEIRQELEVAVSNEFRTRSNMKTVLNGGLYRLTALRIDVNKG